MSAALEAKAQWRRARAAIDPWLGASIALGAALALAAAFLACRRFDALGNDNFDLAFYVRVVWGMARGDRVNSILGAHDMGLHFMPVMVMFAPLVGLVPLPKVLLVAQALALGGSVPLVHASTARVTGSRRAGFALAAAWCLHPALLQIGCREFHPGSLALPALVAALDALDRRHDLAGAVLLALACTTREDVALVAALAGVAVAFEPGRRRFGIGIAAASIAWFLVYVLVVQPAFLPGRGSMEAHFPGWGHDAGGIAAYALANPAAVASSLVGWRELQYLPAVLGWMALVPLVAPRWLMPALPVLAINMISAFPAASDPTSHYLTLALPPLFLATAHGIARLRSLGGERGCQRGRMQAAGLARTQKLACAAVVLACFQGQVTMGATPISLRWTPLPYVMDGKERLLSWYSLSIARHPEVSVMAPAAVIGHLAERRGIYSWAFEHPKPDIAILDLSKRQWVQMLPANWDHPLEREIERLDSDPGYGVWRVNLPFRVMWRGMPGGAQRLASVSPGRAPDGARAQHASWPGRVELVALEASLEHDSEKWSGDYRVSLQVKTTFYWRVSGGRLPPGMLLEMVARGPYGTRVSWLKPTWGIRDTGSWRPGELIRDEQWTQSPGGWPLEAIGAVVRFTDSTGSALSPDLQLDWGTAWGHSRP